MEFFPVTGRCVIQRSVHFGCFYYYKKNSRWNSAWQKAKLLSGFNQTVARLLSVFI